MVERFASLPRLSSFGKRRIPFVQQQSQIDCGPACLTMVLGYHGKHVRLDEVRALSSLEQIGMDAANLLGVAGRFGLHGRGVRIEDPAELQWVPSGTILHWRFHHFVVFDRLGRRSAEILDPALGRRVVSLQELSRSMTGIALILEPGDSFEREGRRSFGIARYLRKILQEPAALGRIVLVSLMLQLLALVFPVLTGVVVDHVVPRGDGHLLAVLALGVVVVGFYRFACTQFRACALLRLRAVLDSRLTREFVEHLIDLPYRFFTQRSTGDLVMRINSNSTIRETLTAGTLSALLDGVLVVFYLSLLFFGHLQLGLLTGFLGLLRVLVFFAFRGRFGNSTAELLQAQANARGYQVQMLSGIETLKACGGEQRAVSHWGDLFVDELNKSIELGRLEARTASVTDVLTTISPMLVLLFGASLVLAGELSIGTMLALSAMAAGFFVPLSPLIASAFDLQRLAGHLDRIEDVLSEPREQDPAGIVEPGRLSGRIAIEEVSFRYGPRSSWAVRGVSLEIEPGQFVGIVGPSGSGKSTLAGLLFGLFPPTEGRVLYDGRNLAEMDLKAARRQFGIVPQTPYIFGASIRRNIALNEPEAPLSKVAAAAQKAAIHDDIQAMPMGYDTVVAERGTSLSGGQRQRIALARALLQRPQILLLDEATSSLDSLTEGKVLAELRRLRATRLVVAHRLSTIAEADTILVMKDGRLCEQGTHGELLKLGGVYAALAAEQGLAT